MTVIRKCDDERKGETENAFELFNEVCPLPMAQRWYGVVYIIPLLLKAKASLQHPDIFPHFKGQYNEAM